MFLNDSAYDGRFSKQKLTFLIGIILISLFLAISSLGMHQFDDAYIHGRLVRNLLTTGDPYFILGEKVKVGSSTGYIYLLALITKITSLEPMHIIRALGSIMIFQLTLSIFWLGFLANDQKARNFLIGILTLPSVLLASYGGMETPIVCLLIIWSSIAYIRKRYLLSIFFISIAVAFRFEAMLIWLAIYIYFFQRVNKLFAIIASAPFFITLLIDLHIYGTIIPHAAKVKSIAYGFPFKDSILNTLSFGYGNAGLILGATIVGFFASQLILIIKDKCRITIADIYFGFSAIILLTWCLSRSMVFPWYLCLLVLPFGVGAILDERNYVIKYVAARRLMIFSILVGLAISPTKSIFIDKSSWRVDSYSKIGESLYRFCNSCSLVTSEIGGIGYSFKGKVYDAFGLSDPVAMRFHPMKVPDERQGYGVGAIPPKYVELRDPDFIVSMPVFSLALRKSEIIAQFHTYDCQLSSNIFGDNVVQVFS